MTAPKEKAVTTSDNHYFGANNNSNGSGADDSDAEFFVRFANDDSVPRKRGRSNAEVLDMDIDAAENGGASAALAPNIQNS